MRFRSVQFLILLGCVSALIYFFVQEARDVLSVTKVGAIDLLDPRAQPIDCGVVLTGGPGRIRESFEILAQKKIKKLIISGVYKETQLHEIFPHLPFYPEVDPRDIILEKISGSTYGNAVQSLALVKPLHCQGILLITSQLHMYRAERIFRTIYPHDIPIQIYPVSHFVNSTRENYIWDVSVETVKSLFYTAFGRVL